MPRSQPRSTTARARSYGYDTELAQGADLGAWIRRGKDGVAGHECVGAGPPYLGDRVTIDAAIDLDHRFASAVVQQETRATHLVHHVRNELLSPEAGIHRHDEQQA